MATLLKKRIRLQGFNIINQTMVTGYMSLARNGALIKEGKIHYRQITDGWKMRRSVYAGRHGKNFWQSRYV